MLPHRVTASAVLCGAVPVTRENRHGLHTGYRLMLPLRMLPKAWISPPLGVASRLATFDPGKAPASWVMRALPKADRHLLSEHPEILEVLAASFREGVRQGGSGVLDDAEIYFQKWKLPLDNLRHSIHYWHGGSDENISADIVREFVARIPGAKLDVVPDEGHFSLAMRCAREAMAHLAAH
jgi:pimeloyl-ACP methyl ester carboxylesterase